ncbi:MAG: hypothetical protein SV375_09790, partial [Thermodesulfobacteriota bacterium]|nr:hypothetical protein [Thermodesulfobacteriota bacterium]
ALFTFYNPLFNDRVKLISSENILEEFAKNSKGAIERSLSHDSKQIIDIPYKNMVVEVTIGPKSKYFIILKTTNDGFMRYEVNDREGHTVHPDKAKIFINPEANRPRLLFKDDECGEWVEPESYYPFTAPAFYEEDGNLFHDEQAGLTVKAIKSSVWHGVPTIAFKFMSGKNSLLFSADTVYRPSLWKELYEEYRPQKFESVSQKKFEESAIIYGDINDFIERTWSRERYEAAMSVYEGSVVIHDVARKNSIVHTDYPDIGNAPIDNLIFTHIPDCLTAWRPFLTSGKRLVLRDGNSYESVKGKLYSLEADVYIRHFSGNFVGYKSKKGAYKVIEKDHLLGITEFEQPGKGLMRVDLYQDLGGEYFPILNSPDQYYTCRQNGKVELVTSDENSSIGRVVENIRGQIGND